MRASSSCRFPRSTSRCWRMVTTTSSASSRNISSSSESTSVADASISCTVCAEGASVGLSGAISAMAVITPVLFGSKVRSMAFNISSLCRADSPSAISVASSFNSLTASRNWSREAVCSGRCFQSTYSSCTFCFATSTSALDTGDLINERSGCLGFSASPKRINAGSSASRGCKVPCCNATTYSPRAETPSATVSASSATPAIAPEANCATRSRRS